MKLLKSFLSISFVVCVLISCQKELSFDLNGPSSGTLKSNDVGDCLPSSVKGVYTVEAALTADNFIEVSLNVSTPGTYTISSDEVNGYSFSGSGTVSTEGINNIKLQGSGIPLVAGTDIFTIFYNNTSCKIAVEVSAPKGSYFPTTPNSWWDYGTNDPNFPGGSLFVKSDDNIVINGKDYRTFQYGPDDVNVTGSSYYKKEGVEYYKRLDASDYTFDTDFDQPLDTVIMFLHEGVTPGTSWDSEFDGNINNQASQIKYTYTLISNNESLDINGHSFTDVFEIHLVTEVKIGNGNYTEDARFEFFYAPDVGLIRSRAWSVANPNNIIEQNIQDFQIF